MDQKNDNNAIRQGVPELEQRIKELERQIEEKDEALRQEIRTGLHQESKSRELLDEERALRTQTDERFSAYIKTTEELKWEKWDQGEKRKEETEEIRKAQAREIVLLQERDEALRQVLVQEKNHELKQCQERIAWAEKQRDEANKKVRDMQQEKHEAEKQRDEANNKVREMQQEKDEASRKAISFEKKRNKALGQRDEALGQKNKILEQLNEALGKRDEALRQKNKILEQLNEALGKRDEALRQLQLSSMLDLFVQCQTSLSSKLASDPDTFQRNPKKATKMTNRFKPLKLHQFHGCEQEQRAVFDELCNVFTPDLLVFTRLITVIEIGEMIETIASEKGLEMFLWAHVEGFARQVFWKLPSADKNSTVCEMYGEITVIHYVRNLDESIGMTASPEEGPGAATTSTQAQDAAPDSADPKTKVEKDKVFKPDGLYVCTKPGKGRGRNILLFPIEIKPGYAVTRQLIASLKDTDTFGEAKLGQPPQPGMHLLWGALMQIYDYMVRSLSSYGMLTTGEVIIFLYIDWSSDATTLYYHVAIPGEPANDTTGAPNDLKEAAFRSAVGQYVTFVLMTMRKCRDMDRKQREGVRAKLTKGDLLPTATKANTGTQTKDSDTNQ
ncbi:hypothetical protein E4U56_005805 [Claviceps arundinis]|uniref:Uncharacterized protein n=1 Tax=Claviceps arundinis TaxID=1623583 RepID=A0A9P7MLZ3_9HYPO|nr:hypothetical protein E4U56_005805 [Claviceps arundinis]